MKALTFRTITGPQLLRAVAVVIAAVAIFHLLLLVCDYSRCFQDAEVFANWAGTVLLQGKSLSLHDLKNAFDCWGMDGQSRPRFLSYLSAIVTLKCRLALWDWLPPHPTFSPVWLLSLILAPWLLYRFLILELGNRFGALLGLGLYLASAGYCSSATFLLHPAKPLSNVVFIATLHAAARARRSALLSGTNLCAENTPFAPWTIVFLTCLFPFFLFTDETALFCLAVFPVYAARSLLPRNPAKGNVQTCALNALAYSVAPIVFAVVTILVAPVVSRPFFKRSFDFISYLGLYDVAGKCDWPHILQHLSSLFTAVLAPWQLLGLRVPIADKPVFSIWLLASYAIVLGTLIVVVFRQRRFRGPFGRACGLMACFIPFQIYLIAHHPQTLVVTGFYYGSIFSVIFSLFVACIATSLSVHRRGGWVAAAIALYVTGIQMSNISHITSSWKIHNNIKTMWWFAQATYNPYLAYADLSEVVKLYSQPIYGGPMYAHDIPEELRRDRFSWTVGLWKNRDAGYRTYLGKRPLALDKMWALSELYYRRTGEYIDEKECAPRFDSAAAALITPKISLVYAAALTRVHDGKPDEEKLPVLAYRYIPETNRDAYGFDTKIAYPWMVRDFCGGVQWLRNSGYSHLIMPFIQVQPYSAPYWSFNDSFRQAVSAGNAGQCRIREVNAMQIMGKHSALFEISP